MGGIVSAGLGLASAFMGKKTASKAAGQSLTGFNYLKGNEGVNAAQTQGQQAGGLFSALLGLGGDQQAAEDAFGQYQDSTGYQFRMEEGMDAITGSAAARGLLNSGSTARGLTRFGQDFASNEFGNYMQMLAGTRDTGLSAAYNVASQGTSGGSGAAAATQQGAKDVMSGVGGFLGGAADIYKRGWGLG